MSAKTQSKNDTPITRRRAGSQCSHCDGSGREPGPLKIEFSREGELRGAMQQLADNTGISAPTISRTLSGKQLASLPTIVLLAHDLGVSESRLIHYPPVWHRLLQELAE